MRVHNLLDLEFDQIVAHALSNLLSLYFSQTRDYFNFLTKCERLYQPEQMSKRSPKIDRHWGLLTTEQRRACGT